MDSAKLVSEESKHSMALEMHITIQMGIGCSTASNLCLSSPVYCTFTVTINPAACVSRKAIQVQTGPDRELSRCVVTVL